MKWAKSLLYLELLVDAEKADYSKYLDYQLVCPVCNQGVYWTKESSRGEHTKKSKTGKIFKVSTSKTSAHFTHFKGGEDCELKVKSFSRKDFQDLHKTFRGQAIKKLWNRFYSIYNFHWSESAMEVKKLECTKIKVNQPLGDVLLENFALGLQMHLKEFDLDRIQQIVKQMKGFKCTLPKLKKEGFKYLEEFEEAVANFSELDARVSLEVLKFLSAKGNLGLAKQLIEEEYATFLSHTANNLMPQDIKDLIFNKCRLEGDFMRTECRMDELKQLLVRKIALDLSTHLWILNLRKFEEYLAR